MSAITPDDVNRLTRPTDGNESTAIYEHWRLYIYGRKLLN